MASVVSAQNSPPPPVPFLFVGLDGGIGPSAGLGALALPGIAEECGGVLRGGDGTSWHASALVELPLDAGLALQILPGLSFSHNALSTTIPGSRPLRSVNEPGGVEQGRIDRALDLYRVDLSLSALARLPIFGRLHAAAGLGMSFPISSETIEREVVIDEGLGQPGYGCSSFQRKKV